MASAFRSSNATTYASRTNTTLTAPAGIQNGDVLLIVHLTGAVTTAPTATAPSGFNLVSGTYPVSTSAGGFNVRVNIWYKIASGESGNYTVTHSSCSSQGYICAISGGSSSQPASTTNNGTASTTTTALTLTTAGNDALVMFVSQDWGDFTNALTPPAGTTPTFSERFDTANTQSSILYVADGVLASAGATGNKTITSNSGGTSNSGWSGYLVAVEASGGGGGSTTVHRNLLLGVGI